MDKRKRILIVTDWYLPATKAGGPVRSIAAIVDKLKTWYDFSIITSDRDLGDIKPYEHVEADMWSIAPDGTRTWYCHQLNSFSAAVKTVIRSEQPDLIYINGIFSHFSRTSLRVAKAEGIDVLLAPRGMLGKGALEIKSFKKRLFLNFAKVRSLYSGIKWHASSEQEKSEIIDVFPDAKVEVALNLAPITSRAVPIFPKQRNQINVVFLSRISRKKNLRYALEVLRNADPSIQIQFDIYGPVEDAEYWKECEAIIAGFNSNVRVVVQGDLAHHEVAAALSNSDVLLFPTAHENFGHVILESLSCGTPVLISDQTPWRNLTGHKAGWDLSLANPDHFTKVIEMVAAMTDSEMEEWRTGAKDFAARYSNDEKLISLNRQLFA